MIFISEVEKKEIAFRDMIKLIAIQFMRSMNLRDMLKFI